MASGVGGGDVGGSIGGSTQTHLSQCHARWLCALAQSTEPECMSILYAKSLLNPAEQSVQSAGGAQRIFVGKRETEGAAQERPVTPPLKPQRCIARMTASGAHNVMTASTPADFFHSHFTDSDSDAATLDSFTPPTSRCADGGGVQNRAGRERRMAPRTVASDYGRWAPKRAQSSSFAGTKCSNRVANRCGLSCSELDYQSNSRIQENGDCSARHRHKEMVGHFSSNKGDSSKSSKAVLGVSPCHRNCSRGATEYRRLPAVEVEGSEEGSSLSRRAELSGECVCPGVASPSASAFPSATPTTDPPAFSAYRRAQRNARHHQAASDSVCCECGRKSFVCGISRSEEFDSNQTICIPSPRDGFTTFVSSSEPSQMSPLRGSLPQLNGSVCSATEGNSSGFATVRVSPPSYSQLRIIRRGNRTTSQVFLNESPLPSSKAAVKNSEAAMSNSVSHGRRSRSKGEKVTVSGDWSQSPPSVDTTSNSSVDSGQGSGEASSHGHSSKELSDSISSFNIFTSKNLPSYARMASTMDHVLRTSSAIYATLNLPPNSHSTRELLTKATVFIQIVETSALSPYLPTKDITYVRQIMSDLLVELSYSSRPPNAASHFAIMLRRLLEQVLVIFARVIARYLLECTNKDRLLTIALEHLIHLMLFGDEICLETVKCGGLNAILSFCEMPTTPADTLRLLLRALAVLCGVTKGCVKLISLGGFEVILHILCVSSIACAVEAAGVLTQLTNPAHNFVRCQSSFAHVIARLLDIIDECVTAESLLLCSAAVANLASQQTSLVECLYTHNATSRLIAAMNRPHCETIFVQEQIATIFSRQATAGYVEALIAQGAIPVLLSMLSTSHPTHSEYCRRIRYKAAACIATIASKGVGLRAIFEQNGYSSLSKVLQNEKLASDPAGMLCSNVREMLERKYQIESAV